MNSMSSRDPNVACRHCGEHFNSDDKAPKNGVTQAALVSPATAIDVSNLRFYSAMAQDFKWQTDVIHWSVISKTLQEIADRVTEAAPVSPRPELVAELLEALKVTLPWLAHRSECMVLLPASEWEKRESWVAQNCCCGIAKFEALIKKAEDTLTPPNSAKETTK